MFSCTDISRKSQCVGTRSRWLNAGSLSPTCLQRSGESLYEIICHNKHRQTQPLHRLRPLRRSLPQDVLTMQWNRCGEYNDGSRLHHRCGLCLKNLPVLHTGKRGYIGAAPGGGSSAVGPLLPRLIVGYSGRHQRQAPQAGWRPGFWRRCSQGHRRPCHLRRPHRRPEGSCLPRSLIPQRGPHRAGSAYYRWRCGSIRQVIGCRGATPSPACHAPQGVRLAQQRNKKLRGGSSSRRPRLRTAEERRFMTTSPPSPGCREGGGALPREEPGSAGEQLSLCVHGRRR